MAHFMDFHRDMHGLTVRDLQLAHENDEKVQEKYGVKYLKFWVNEKDGNVFCLVDAPDIESCISVHREAHPDYMACAIIEVDPGFIDIAMGANLKDVGGLVQQEDGNPDPGHRTILMTDVTSKTGTAGAASLHPSAAKSAVRSLISEFGGRLLEVAANDVITAMFTFASGAVKCAAAIHELFEKKNEGGDSAWGAQCRIGIAAGQPVTEKNDFFEDTLRLARIMVSFCQDGRLNLSSLVGELCSVPDLISAGNINYNIFAETDERFLHDLHHEIHDNLATENLTVARLGNRLGTSRAQLYRKVHSLTGRSPNELIRDLRMQQALFLLHKQDFNVSEVSLRVGISNPSYFSKCFQDKYGILPSKLVV